MCYEKGHRANCWRSDGTELIDCELVARHGPRLWNHDAVLDTKDKDGQVRLAAHELTACPGPWIRWSTGHIAISGIPAPFPSTRLAHGKALHSEASLGASRHTRRRESLEAHHLLQ
ncbi:hypothetical protein Atai01_79760 [Amycolatopsis taiwanensis]|uniref:Uncharacterized protein n=1 Tax=Amycolatopsis taiwanensis TaxID=342230 RepID=A0A9W6RC33_9PSEU|nr:hypothetical protein Atai01_79760 [Amycolatopsis taiwanensis]